jgi:hypothetical protein
LNTGAHVSVPAVVSTLDLQDLGAPGRGPSKADTVVHGVGATPTTKGNSIGSRQDATQPFGQTLFIGMRHSYERPNLVCRFDDGGVNLRMGVAEDCRPEATVKVDIGIAIDVVEPLSLGTGKRKWERP